MHLNQNSFFTLGLFLQYLVLDSTITFVHAQMNDGGRNISFSAENFTKSLREMEAVIKFCLLKASLLQKLRRYFPSFIVRFF